MKIIRLLTAILMCMLSVLLTGCRSETVTTASSTPVAVTPRQSQAEGVAKAYVAALQAGSYSDDTRHMSPRLRAQTPMAAWKTERSGSLQPLAMAKDLTFDAAQAIAHGQRMILRAHFTGGNGTQYRTNFVLAQSGSSWLVDDVIPPVAAHQSVIVKKGKLTRQH